jgi:DNA repair photolyase
MESIGITERGDAALDTTWRRWVERGRPAILITKNVGKLLDDNPLLLNQRVIVHATITGYGDSFIEPNVPPSSEMMDALASIEIKYREQVVVRIDPIIPVRACVEQSHHVFEQAWAMGYRRFRVSILDLYPHVMRRFDKYTLFAHELKQVYRWNESMQSESSIHCDHSIRAKIFSQFRECDRCAEPGLRCRGCISSRDLKILNVRDEPALPEVKQRQFCMCLANKTELLYNKTRCDHSCEYCYWQG